MIHDSGAPGGQLRDLCTVIRVGGKDGYVPTMGSATWGAIAEEANYSTVDSTPATGQVEFATRKSGGQVIVSRELLDDSQINLPQWLATVFAEAEGQYQDDGILDGNGTTEYTGLSQASITAYTAAGTSALTAADILGIHFEIPAQFADNATWVMKSSTAGAIAGIASTAAGLHATPDLTVSPVRALVGDPVVRADTAGSGLGTIAANSTVAYYGNYRNYYIFERMGMSIQRNPFDRMQTDQISFYATKRGDGRVALANAFRGLKMAAS